MTEPTEFDENYKEEKLIEQDFTVRFEFPATKKGKLISADKQKYELIGRLGQGASGEVWLGLNAEYQPMAIKFLRKKTNSGDSFVQELLTLAQVVGPNIVEIIDAGFGYRSDEAGSESGYFLAMEYYPKPLINIWKD